MEALVNTVSEFLAAIFARFGFVGRQRRRANIQEDLSLLHLLRDSPAFGSESTAAVHLAQHIDKEVDRYSGIEPKRKIDWSAVVTAVVFGVPSAYFTYKLNQDGFSWLSIPLGAVASFMLIGGIGLLFSGDKSTEEEGGS